jgi:uncharacterized membrane protein YhaH (DUF805 family)
MGNAISACFSKYATFTGRAKRSEYWFFYLFYVLVYIGSIIVGSAAHSPIIALIGELALVLPLLSAGVRRMHDVDKSGWFILIPFYNLVLLCTEGTSTANRFGPPSQQQ